MAQTSHEEIRAEHVSSAIRGILSKKFKLLPLLAKETSTAWTESYFKETNTILTAQGDTNADFRGIPRGADFTEVNAEHVLVQGQHLKWGGKTTIFLEDKLTSAINVQARNMAKLVEGLVNNTDLYIYAQLTGDADILTGASNAAWDDTTVTDRQPIDDILAGIQTMDEADVDVLGEQGLLLLSPKDHRSLIGNSKVINNPSYKTADVVSNGRVGQIAGLTIIKTTSVTADEAMILVNQSQVWQTVEPLKTAIIDDPGVKVTIRAWQIGQIQIVQPKKIYVITNTQKT